MVNISKGKLDEKVLERIYKQFSKMVLELKHNTKGSRYIDALLTSSEKIMLAKRLAIIVMIDGQYSHYKIGKTLKVSESTVAKLHKKLSSGELDAMRGITISKQQRESFWADIEVLVRGGMPEYGKGRWKKLNELNKRK